MSAKDHGWSDKAIRAEKLLYWPIIIAAALVIPCMILEASHLGYVANSIGDVLNWLIWITFLVEMLTMTCLTPGFSWWKKNPLDVAIVFLTPPISASLLQGLRFFRLLRVLRILKLATLIHNMNTIRGLQYALFVASLIVVFGGAAFIYVEPEQHLGLADGLWWAISTVTTVGYGDITPHTTTGRALATLIMLTGISTVALLTAVLAEKFVTTSEEEVEDIHKRLDKIEDHLQEILKHLSK